MQVSQGALHQQEEGKIPRKDSGKYERFCLTQMQHT